MVKKKKIAITIVKIIAFAGILIVLLLVANKVLIKKENIAKYERFYEEKSDFDILFIGSSRVLDAFQPMELWDDYGIRSYNLAQHSEGLAVDYWQLMNALDNNHPQLVVMDISMFYSGGVDVSDEASRAAFHKIIDHMPLSMTKIQTIRNNVPKELYAEYAFPFILYHSRWNLVNKSDFIKNSNTRMGAEIRTNIMPQEKFVWDNYSLSETFEPQNVNLDKIIQLCDERGIDLLFICMPCNENQPVNPTLNQFEKYFEQNGVNYINISRDENYLNYAVDFADESHVNVAGSHKLTAFIGQYFSDNYCSIGVDDSVKEDWNNILKSYQEEKDNMIISMSEDPVYLMNLVYSDNDYYVTISGKMDLLEKYQVFDFYSLDEVVINDDLLEIVVYRINETQSLSVVTKSE